MSEYTRGIAITVVFLALSLGVGAWMTARNPEVGQQVMSMIRDTIIGEALDSSRPVLALKIFINNLQACVLMFLGGATLGALTVFIIGTNGFVIGSILELVGREHSSLYVAAALVPHGIFEIPAFVISGALGFSLAAALLREGYGEGDAADRAREMGRLFLVVVLPLVAVAALVEAFITPEILRMVV